MNKLNLSLLTTALLACGFNAAAEQSQVVSKQLQVQAPQSEEDYYDEGEDFDTSSHGSEQAWGWSSVKKDDRRSLTEESSSSEEPPPPPTSLNGTKHITYSPFTILGNNQVSWAAINGYGSAVTYTLQQQKNNGSWGTIFTGTSTSRNLYNLSDGLYKYRVKGCTSSICSPYVEYVHAQVKNNPYNRAAASAVKGEKDKDGQQTRAINDFTVAKLGYGFDMTRGEPLSSKCWVQSDANIVGSTTTAISKELVYSVANTSEELATQLDLQTSVDVSAEYGGYSAEYKYTKQLFSKTRTEKDSSVIVAKLKDTRSQVVAKGEPTLQLSDWALDQLKFNKSNFRNTCGDKYIDRLTMGRFAYVTIKVTSETKTKEEIETTTKQLKVDLKDAEGAYNNTTAQQLSSKYAAYNLDIYSTMIGSGANVVKLTDFTQLVSFLNDFENDNSSSLYPVGYSQRYYNVPTYFGNASHFSVFTDYRSYAQKLSYWTSLDRQVAERCYYFDRKSSVLDESQVDDFVAAGRSFVNGESLDGLCSSAKRIIADNIINCASHQDWPSCVSPTSSQCIDDATGATCMTAMSKLPVWDREVKTSDLYVRAPGGCWSTKNYDATVQVCLNPNTIIDFTKQWTISDHTSTVRDGLGTTQYSQKRVRRVTHTPKVENGNQQCIVSYAQAYCSGRLGGGPGGWYGSNQWLHGLAPHYQSYYFQSVYRNRYQLIGSAGFRLCAIFLYKSSCFSACLKWRSFL